MTEFVGDHRDNVWRITSADGDSSVSGGLGYDGIVIDWSDALTGYVDFESSPVDEAGSGSFRSPDQEIIFTGIEHISGILSAGGDSVASGGGGRFALDGGAGYDYLNADMTETVGNIVFALAGPGIWSTFLGQGSHIKNFEEVSVRTGIGHDRLIGNDHDTSFASGGGNDYLDGRGGTDELRGEDGNDRLFGGDGQDTVLGGVGNDLIDGGEGDDKLHGEAGIDTLSYASAGSGVTLIFNDDLSPDVSGGGGQDLLLGFEGIVGSRFADTLKGDSKVNFLDGAAGDDVITGGLGHDTISGGGGSDSLNGGSGADRILGGAGVDTLTGEAGTDRLEGGGATDALLGGVGGDTLIGGQGRDVSTGGAGLDLFIFNNGDTSAARAQADVITDFSHADGDRINLRGIDADSATADVDDKFSFLGTGAFTGEAGQLRYAVVDGNIFVQGDTDGDQVADFLIRLDGLPTLVAADFVL
jgi:Ca2+-binding RTX toxin-like protein